MINSIDNPYPEHLVRTTKKEKNTFNIKIKPFYCFNLSITKIVLVSIFNNVNEICPLEILNIKQNEREKTKGYQIFKFCNHAIAQKEKEW